MARSIWTGAVSFGLVSVPVKMYGAVTPKGLKFNQINSKSGARIKQLKVDAGTAEVVKFEDIVKGFEITPDRYVLFDPEELEAVAPAKTGAVALEKFVDETQIDPMLYDASYYLAPAPGGAKPYRLLAEAMRQSGKAGIGRVILRSKEKIAVLRATDDGELVMSTLCWADEVNDCPALDPADVSPAELTMACQLIESMDADFDHHTMRDEYRDKVMAMIEAKAAGTEMPVEEKVEELAPAPDLMAALTASLATPKVTPAGGQVVDAPEAVTA